ncbi:hypothetical protein LguiB_016099 [Lonicera macranthoides]
MDHERSDAEKLDEIMLPGFRFHPTDEELVGFYLKRKVQQRPLSIELIKQLDIYKYDPWDLPKLATTGEKEWYFYCPRDRKYRNSARPNRVTGAGFWKATGTDRPIYSSEGSKCIGLKKSLVFYKGRAAKGIKTDWMMHEFRLPTLTDSASSKRFIDKNIPPNVKHFITYFHEIYFTNLLIIYTKVRTKPILELFLDLQDLWAICRIFKKANSTAQRALSHAWVSPVLPERPSTELSSLNQYGITNNDLQHYSSITSFSPNFDAPPPHKPFNQMASGAYTFFSPETSEPTKHCTVDASSVLLNMSSSIFGDFGKTLECLDYSTGLQEHYVQNGGLFITLPQDMQENIGGGEERVFTKDQSELHFDEQWEANRSLSNSGFPFNLLCDSSPCPSDQMSTSYSTDRCYA